jgi:uncharacterized membrane protein YfcA
MLAVASLKSQLLAWSMLFLACFFCAQTAYQLRNGYIAIRRKGRRIRREESPMEFWRDIAITGLVVLAFGVGGIVSLLYK